MSQQSQEETSSMSSEPTKSLPQLVRDLGRFPIEAFEFLHEGLDHTVCMVHGPASDAIRDLYHWMDQARTEPQQLTELARTGGLPKVVFERIIELGGPDAAARKLNRHVSGVQLCWGLRDLAMRRWGLMASAVLRHWGIRSTADFGAMVFALVNAGMLHKQPHDDIDDFDDVFDFDEVFDRSYKIGSVSSDDEA